MAEKNNEKTKLSDIEDGGKLRQLIELLPFLLELEKHKTKLLEKMLRMNSGEFEGPTNFDVKSKQKTEEYDTWEFSPIIIANLKTMSQDFKNFIVEIREKGNYSTIVRKTAQGIKTGLYWEMEPLIIEHTKTGTEYEIRICVQALDGNKSSYSEWLMVTAGE